MTALLALLDAVVSDLVGNDESTSAIHARSAELRRDTGPAAGSIARADSLVQATSERLGISLADAYQLVGERVVPLLAVEMAAQLRRHSTAHTFCLHLNAIVQSELQAMVPTVPLPFVDVEMLDFTALRLSFVGDGNALALAKGLLSGVARCYGQEARFLDVPPSQISQAAVRDGRRYLDLAFVPDARADVGLKRPVLDEQRRASPAVALRGLFR